MLEETGIGITAEEESAVEGVASVDCTVVLVSTGIAVLSLEVDTTTVLVSAGVAVLSTEVALGIVCGWMVARVVVTVTRPPVSGETA